MEDNLLNHNDYLDELLAYVNEDDSNPPELLPESISPLEFSERVHDRVWMNDERYIDAVVNVCEEYSIEPETVKPLITNTLYAEIEAECVDLHLIKNANPKTKLWFL